MNIKSTKKYSIRIIITALILSLFFTSANAFIFGMQTIMNINAQTENLEDEIERPDSLEEGLKRKTLEEIGERRVTIRQPIMEVLERNLPRTEPEVLDNKFTLANFDTREEYKNATVNFTRYPSKGTPEFKNNNESARIMTNFEKYMLLRQSMYNNKWAMKDAEDGVLKKHPAADGIYGEIPVEANAVKKRIVTDPIYKSPMTTGLYLAPGETAEIEVSGLKPGNTLTLYTHHQTSLGYVDGYDANAYFNNMDTLIINEAKNENPDFNSLPITLNGQWLRQNALIPCMVATFEIKEDGKYKIGCPYGGPLYVKPTTSCVEMIITGAIETPHFILGVTTVEEFESTLRNAPGLIATLDCENGQLIGPSADMRNCDDIEKLAYFWHSVFAINSSFNGRAYNYNVTLAFDTHVPAGSAVALSANYAAQPLGWFSRCMNYADITTKGQWGTFHELGHIHAQAYNTIWGMREEKEGEVRNNVLIVLIYTMLCNMDSRLTSIDEHGEYAHPYTNLSSYFDLSNKGVTDYSQFDYFPMISMYANLIHAFSPEKFVDFFYTYSLNQNFCEDHRADFVYRMALVNHVNIKPWLNSCYYANINDEDFDEEQLAFINSLDEFYPIAYKWSNGIDGHETARKYEVDVKNPTVFDFSNGNILCPVDYEIIDFINPQYGSIQVSANKEKVTYTPPTNLIESDGFGVKVRVHGGREVVLNVNFNFLYNNSYSEVWDDITNINNLQVSPAREMVKDRDFTYSEVSSTPGKTRWSYTNFSYVKTKFKFMAKQSGHYSFYLKADDSSLVNVYDELNSKIGEMSTTKDKPNYEEERKVEVDLNNGDILLFDCELVNWGGPGYLTVGVKFPESDNIVDIPKQNLLNYNLQPNDLEIVNNFKGWVPKFFVSIKNTPITRPVDKQGWEVIEHPISHVGGTDGAGPTAIVDGDEKTFFHSSYSNNKTLLPHTFVFDTKKIQDFNYFEIVTRNNGNSYITSAQLFVATENNEQSYKKVYDNENVKYSNLRTIMEFEKTPVRYIKLIVRATTGNNFTVISEVYAGINCNIEQTVKPSKFAIETKGFNENSANGQLTTSTKGSIFAFEFIGTGFDLFADVSSNYGTAKITIDGQDYGEISLVGETCFNALVFSEKNLQSAKHVVEIETTSDSKFNIGYINVDYGADITYTPTPRSATNSNQFNFVPIIIAISVCILVASVVATIIVVKRKKQTKA